MKKKRTVEHASHRAALWLAPAMVLLTPYYAQAQDVPWTDTIHALLDNVTNVIAPAIGICGFIAVGASAMMGETGKVFKIGIAVVVGATLMAKAQTIWTSIFGGAG